ncbi:MAG: radical SAM protein, partial [Candidatus Omnitrophica bacterium]|nr:radical SAM protein [Candidatus Omnitrophota bacterium]
QHILQDKYGVAPKSTARGTMFGWGVALEMIGLLAVYVVLVFWVHGNLASGAMKNAMTLVLEFTGFLFFIFFTEVLCDEQPHIKKRFVFEKELFLVNPIFGGVVSALALLAHRIYPGAFPVLKALTPPEYKVWDFNAVLWKDWYYKGKVLVGITCFTSNSAEAYRIARTFKQKGATVVMGGPHVMYFPEEALQYCDSVVVGQAEGVWADVVRDYEAGAMKRIYAAPPEEAHFQRVQKYLLSAPPLEALSVLETTRGCKFQCYFCTNPTYLGTTYRKKALEDMIALVRHASKASRRMLFLDVNIFADPAYAKAFFRALIPLRVRWQGCGSVDIGADEEALRFIKESGCELLLVGYEVSGGSPEEARGGKFAMVSRYEELTRKIKRAGIKVKGTFIFGFDTDDFGAFCKLWWFCFRLFVWRTSVSVLTPLPGSQFFVDVARADRFLNLNWRKYDAFASVVVRPGSYNFFLSQIGFLLVKLLDWTTSTTGVFFVVVGPFICLKVMEIWLR